MSTRIDNTTLLQDLSPNDTPNQPSEVKADVSIRRVSSSPTQNSQFSPRAIIVAALILVAIATAGYFFGKKNLTTERHHPVIEVSPESLDFGVVKATSQFKWRLEVENVSPSRIEVISIKSTWIALSFR